MGSISFEDIIASKPFRFFVGPQKREFTMHSALVAACSPALDTLVNGDYKEAKDGFADLPSVNEETFILFAQYAYTGAYNRESSKEANSSIVEKYGEAADDERVAHAVSEEPALLEELAEPEPEPEPEVDWWGATSKKKCKKCGRSGHDENTTTVTTTTTTTMTRRDSSWRAFKNECSGASPARRDWPAVTSCISNIFLSHAQLYVFADCYGISGLMDLSLDKLGKALVDTVLDGDVVEDVVDTLSYCYDELTPPKLRSLLVLYAACKVETLWKSEQFRELLTRHGELSTTLVGAMISRLD